MSDKKFSLTDWLLNKKNRKIILIVVFVIIGIALGLRVKAHLGGMMAEAKLPDGGLSAQQEPYEEREAPDYLTNDVLDSDSRTIVKYWENTFNDAGRITSSVDGVGYIVGASSEDVTAISREYFKVVSNGAFLVEDGITILERSSGYIGHLPAEFCLARIRLREAAGNVTCYSIVYSIDTKGISEKADSNLILYAYSGFPEKLCEAQEVLKEMALSAKEFDPEAYWDGIPDLDEEDETPYSFPIDVEWKSAEDSYEDAVMMVQWDNIFDEPVEFEVTGPNGQVGWRDAEYSIAGHYVIRFGKTQGDTYHIKGGTNERMINCIIDVMEWDTYMDLYHYVDAHDGEVPDYIHNRPAEDEDY